MSCVDTYKYPKIESNTFFISPNSTVIVSSDADAYLNRANYSGYLTRAQVLFYEIQNGYILEGSLKWLVMFIMGFLVNIYCDKHCQANILSYISICVHIKNFYILLFFV